MTSEIAASRPSLLQSLFRYKAWANTELLSLLRSIDAAVHADVARRATRILNHAHVVDRIFKAHLESAEHGFSATNTIDTPTPQALSESVGRIDAWYLTYVSNVLPPLLREQVRFAFTDGETGSMSREEMLLHVITHGGYHRGQAGQVLSAAGAQAPRDLYTRFLHAEDPGRRVS